MPGPLGIKKSPFVHNAHSPVGWVDRKHIHPMDLDESYLGDSLAHCDWELWSEKAHQGMSDSQGKAGFGEWNVATGQEGRGLRCPYLSGHGDNLAFAQSSGRL